MRPLLPCVLCAAALLGCDAPPIDLDAGNTDQCFDVPTKYQGALCVVGTSNNAPPCKPSLAQARAFAFPNCDGGVLEGACSNVTQLRWVLSASGDGYECFYLGDGGLFGGAITSNGNTIVTGTLADCSLSPSAQACDGGP